MSQDQSRTIRLAGDAQMVFVQNHKLVLQAGEYRLTVAQHVVANGKFDQTFESEHTFAVKGERFSLGAQDVRSVFPPKNAQGEFSNVLPQIVLNPKTLPWERTPRTPHKAGDAVTAGITPAAPWLALFLFTSDDPAPEVQNLSVGDLFPATLPSGTLTYPGIQTLEYGESAADPCAVIDVPLPLFNAIAPAAEDLEYLAHARQVEMKNTEGETPDGVRDVAVIIGNRLPGMGKDSVMHLVSLEGMADYLPDAEGNVSAAIPKDITSIRLLSLYSWKFYALNEAHSFTYVLEHLNASPNTLTIPVPDEMKTTVDAKVIQALGLGYTAMDRTTRQGDKDVAWYRGPLVPGPVEPENRWPANSADDVIRFDPETGMFDMSYAAAWILGRQLGLQNKLFTGKLYAWRHAHKQAAILASARVQLQARVGQTLFAAASAPDSSTRMWLHSSLQALTKVKHIFKNGAA